MSGAWSARERFKSSAGRPHRALSLARRGRSRAPAGEPQQIPEPPGEGPSLWSMVKIVAISVALIILIGFAAGYGFGRMFV